MDHYRMVVRNTFVEVCEQSAGHHHKGLRRTASDPALFTVSEEAARVGKCSEPDSDSQGECESQLLCYSHIAKEEEKEEGPRSSSKASGSSSSWSGGAHDGVCSLLSGCSTTTSTCNASSSDSGLAPAATVVGGGHKTARPDVADAEHLICENACLAHENKLLRERCLEEPGCTATAAVANGDAARATALRTPLREALRRGADLRFGLVKPLPSQLQPPQQPCMLLAAADEKPEALQHQGRGQAAFGVEDPHKKPLSRRQRAQLARTGMLPISDGIVPGSLASTPPCCASGTDALGTIEATTVMLRNLPNNYSRVMLLGMLDKEGFAGQYDFVYLPIDFTSHACLGYAFINLVDPALIHGFWNTFDGYTKWIIPSRKACHVSWSGPLQGYQAHVERYRNSPVMHESVTDEFKPIVFSGGRRIAFPAPTKTPKAPRNRH